MSKVTWTEPKVLVDKLNNTSIECHVCGRITNHKSLAQVSFSETYHSEDEYENSITGYKTLEILQCQGCMEPTLKTETSNTEDMDFSTYQLNINIDYYPKRKELTQFEHSYRLPTALCDLYSETITAINNNCLTIAGIGIRGLIETICKEEKIEGNNLFEKIDNLFTEGKISSDGKSILHSLRKLYNKSAHDSFKPSQQQLLVSLDILELLMKQIYVHTYDAKIHFSDEKNV
ncbi:TPA: DUF4145 domain-containing protein [Klebsiella oxytoca]